MPVIPLTLDNLDHLKRAARAALPELGSSHLTEALAALLGHRTHAALLATASMPSAAPLLVRPDPSRFVERLRSLGHTTLDATAVLCALASADPPIPAWREFKNGDVDSINGWFRSCQRRCVPNIHVATRRKLARVDWDWISVDPRQDHKLGRTSKRHVVGRMFAALQKHAAPRKAVFYGSAFVGHIDGLAFESARIVADEIALILNEAQRIVANEAA